MWVLLPLHWDLQLGSMSSCTCTYAPGERYGFVSSYWPRVSLIPALKRRNLHDTRWWVKYRKGKDETQI